MDALTSAKKAHRRFIPHTGFKKQDLSPPEPACLKPHTFFISDAKLDKILNIRKWPYSVLGMQTYISAQVTTAPDSPVNPKKKPTGFSKANLIPSPALCEFLGVPSGTKLARTDDITRRVCHYLNDHDLFVKDCETRKLLAEINTVDYSDEDLIKYKGEVTALLLEQQKLTIKNSKN